MTKAEKISFKQKLKQAGLAVIEQRMASAQQLMQEAQESANAEGKSSAGDKYETARAMGHLQKDMYARQFSEQAKERAALQTVNVDTVVESVTTGAYVQCGKTTFFIAAGLGKQEIDGSIVFFLSPQAPLALLMQHKKAGDHFVFNNTHTIIAELF